VTRAEAEKVHSALIQTILRRLDYHTALVAQLLTGVEVAAFSEGDECPTVAVELCPSGRVRMLYGDAVWDLLTPSRWEQEMQYLAQHEVLHILLGHTLRIAEMCAKYGAQVARVAADCVVDDFLPAPQSMAPKLALTRAKEALSRQGLLPPPGASWDQYCAALAALGDLSDSGSGMQSPGGGAQSPGGSSQSSSQSPSQSSSQSPSPQPEAGSAEQASSAGQRPTDGGAAADGAGSAGQSQNGGGSATEGQNGKSTELDGYVQKVPGEGLPDTLISEAAEKFAAQVRELDRQLRSRGVNPGGMQEVIDNFLRPRPVPLRLLQQMLSTRRQRPSYSKPNKRRGPGYPGLRRERCQGQLVVAYDTSASMGKEDLGLALGQIQEILKEVEGDLDFLQFDADIQGVKTVRVGQLAGLRDWLRVVQGRGGTDYRPVIEWWQSHRPGYRLVVITDGYAPIPPLFARLVWLITDQERVEEFRAAGHRAYYLVPER